jgi:tetratricopeptide (TPR) repeat protein
MLYCQEKNEFCILGNIFSSSILNFSVSHSDKIFSLQKGNYPLTLKLIFLKAIDFSAFFAVFLTPLLFFTKSRDQFELPKLTVLLLLLVPFLLWEWNKNKKRIWTPLFTALAALFVVQALASLPFTSLSWRTSLLGDYENFSGLLTLSTYLLWFLFFYWHLNETIIRKLLYFNSLAALLSALYALGQHHGFDFVLWNPESINAMREFASLGNPNFLSAYLAISIPLFLCLSLNPFSSFADRHNQLGFFVWFLGCLGFVLLAMGTGRGLSLLRLEPLSSLHYIFSALGLLFFSIVCMRLLLMKHWTVAFFGTTLLFCGLMSTESRGGFLGAVFGLLVWAFLALLNKAGSFSLKQLFSRLFKPYLIPCLVLAILLSAIVGHGFINRLSHSITHTKESLEVSRLHIWRPALQMVKDKPLLGVGLDTFKIAFPYYSGIEFNRIDGMFTSSRTAHNELLQMASTTGLLGLVAYLLVLLTFFLLIWKVYRSAAPERRWLLNAIVASALAYHIQNLFSFSVAALSLLWILFLAIAQNFHLPIRFEKPPPPSPFSMSFLYIKRALIVLLIFFLLFFPLRRLSADICFGRSSALSEFLQKPDPDVSSSALPYYSDAQIRYMKRAVALFPWDVKYELYLGLAYEQRAPLDPERSRDWYLKAVQSYQKAVSMSPANAYYYNDLGRIFSTLGRGESRYFDDAEQAYEKSVQWAPASPAFIINWAVLLQKRGNNQLAREQFNKAFDLDRRFSAKTLAQMGLEQYRAGEKQLAFQCLNEAIRGNTACAEAFYCRGVLFLTEKNPKKALEDFKKTLELNPTPEQNPSIRFLDELIRQSRK